MHRASVEVGSGIACFSAAVRAASTQRAVSIVDTRYPGRDTQMSFSIDPELFFVKGPAVMIGAAEFEMPESIAG